MSLYIEQEPRVSKGLGTHQDAIRVTFADVTLCLSLVDASWLAANIQREIRLVEQENPEAVVAFAEANRENLKPGARVVVRDDNSIEAEYEVKYAPWQLGHGKWVIGLKGISGGYSLDRVVKIVRLAEIAP